MSVSCCEGGERRDSSLTARPEIEDVRQASTRAIKWRVRPMRHADIEKCLEIWLQVELTEAHVTVASALETDPEGFYVAELESGRGEVIGMCSGTMTRLDTAFMGFYAVAPEYQGLGIGRELWARTMARLERAQYNIGLYGVPAMSEKYKRTGFKVEDSIRMLIFESQPGAQLATNELRQLEELEDHQETGEFSWRLEKVNGGQANESLIEKLIEYDSLVYKYSRNRLLRNYLIGRDERSSIDDDQHAQTPLTLAVVRRRLRRDSNSDLRQEDEMMGYGCIRHDNTGGAMIGPLYARSDDICQVILGQLVECFNMRPGGKYSVMSLTSCPLAGELLERIGLHEMDQCSRMFTRFVPEASLDQIYYVHSPNFTLF